MLQRIASALGFPSWFGGNWDALFDCLADLSWQSARTISGQSGLQTRTPRRVRVGRRPAQNRRLFRGGADGPSPERLTMPLHPVAEEYLAEFAARGRPFNELPPAEARAAYEIVAAEHTTDEPLGTVTDTSFDGPAGRVAVRIYLPMGDGPFPATVYLHGGGWVIGSIRTHDALCRSLAARSGCAVVAPDYGLAPECPFPAGLEDCYATLRWVERYGVAHGIDGTRLAVAGDSSGGNLAAATALLTHYRGGPTLRLQVVLYGVTDQGYEEPSCRDLGTGYLPTLAMMRWFTEQYLTDRAQVSDPRASPLRASQFDGLPAAYVVTAEYDLLRDQGKAYAERLRTAGVPVAYHEAKGMIHGFMHLLANRLEDGQRAIDDTAAALKVALTAKP